MYYLKFDVNRVINNDATSIIMVYTYTKEQTLVITSHPKL